MHNPALAAVGAGAQYVRVQVPVGCVPEAFHLFREAGFLGVNITIPHKFEALQAVDEVDPLAEQLGAVNTLVLRDGRMLGYNTDGPGFLRSIEEAFGADLRELRVLILGAGGGAGRAVAVQCVLHGCRKLLLTNRTEQKARDLAAELESMALPEGVERAAIKTVPWGADALRQPLAEVDLIVNATSLGMKAGDSPLIPTDALRPKHLVFDMVYGSQTPLIEAAKKVGAKWVDGQTLLLHQGAISFEHWLQRPAPLEEMRQGLAAS